MPTYENLITTREVALAIEQLYVAPEGTTWIPTRVFDNTGVPGFMNLGAVVEDTPQLSITKEKFQLQTGIPRILQYQAVRGLGGQFTCSLHSNSNRIVRWGLGNVPPIKVTAPAVDITTMGSALGISSIDPVGGNRLRIQISTAAAVGSMFAVGDVVSVGTSPIGLIQTEENEAEILKMGATTDRFGNNVPPLSLDTPGWLTMNDKGFVFPVSVTHRVARVLYSRIPFGTKAMPFYVLLGVADFIDGVQVIHHCKKAAPAGEWTEQIRPDANVTVAVTWDLLGYSTQVYGGSELIVGERFYIPKLS